MINTSTLTYENINKINGFTNECTTTGNKISKNGNSLKLVLEMGAYDLGTADDFHNNQKLVHTSIDRIQNNIKITKN